MGAYRGKGLLHAKAAHKHQGKQKGKFQEKKPGDKRLRWQKGYCPNPGGRPKGSVSMTHLIMHIEQEQIPTTKAYLTMCRAIGADPENMTHAELTARLWVYLAQKGHAIAMKEIWNRIDGRVPLVLNHGGEIGRPITIDLKRLPEEKLRALKDILQMMHMQQVPIQQVQLGPGDYKAEDGDTK